jgi:mRNA interferase MazF
MVSKQDSSSSGKNLPDKNKAHLPKKIRNLSRGEVWLVALNPTLGSEIKKTRPCLIISPPEIHDYLQTAIAAPMTTGGNPAPFRVPVHFKGKAGLILLDQIRALDKQRLVRYLGTIETSTLNMTLSGLQDMFAE